MLSLQPSFTQSPTEFWQRTMLVLRSARRMKRWTLQPRDCRNSSRISSERAVMISRPDNKPLRSSHCSTCTPCVMDVPGKELSRTEDTITLCKVLDDDCFVSIGEGVEALRTARAAFLTRSVCIKVQDTFFTSRSPLFSSLPLLIHLTSLITSSLLSLSLRSALWKRYHPCHTVPISTSTFSPLHNTRTLIPPHTDLILASFPRTPHLAA